jgi:ABC-2 type transport system permease protein
MSTVVTPPAFTESETRLHPLKPDFLGLLNGELFKIRRMKGTWILLTLLMVLIFLPYLVSFTVKDIQNSLVSAPLQYFYNWLAINLGLFRAFSGFVLTIITARVIGQEYNLGTIRILLARGVGRIQLLLTKLTAVAIVALVLLIIGLGLNAVLSLALVQIATGNFNAISSLTADFWQNAGLYTLSIAISMAATILLAAFLTVLGRSLAFGLSFSIAWFPVDNILVSIMSLAFLLTQNTFWQKITAYFLGPNLNVMPMLLPHNPVWDALGAGPLVTVDGTHTLIVTLVYAVIFIAAAIALLLKRDIKE